MPLSDVPNAAGGDSSADIVMELVPQSADAPLVVPLVPDGESLPPWDIRRWPTIPVPQDQRIVPTLTTEGPDVFRNFAIAEVFDASGKRQEGTIFKVDGVLKVWDDGKTHSCDEVGNHVTKKAIIRPPSHTPESWSQVPGHRRKYAWIKFWDGEDKAVSQTSFGQPGQPVGAQPVALSASHSSSSHSAYVADCLTDAYRTNVPYAGLFVDLPKDGVAKVRSALDALGS